MKSPLTILMKSLAEKLLENSQPSFAPEGCPDIQRGQVVGIEGQPLPEGVVGWLEAHPEGSDRGGYLPYLKTPSGDWWFDENGDGWYCDGGDCPDGDEDE